MPATNLVVTNFSGGKRHSGVSLVGDDGVPELVRLANSLRTESGLVMAIQEMTTTEAEPPTRAIAVEEGLGAGRSSFVAQVSTAWYPLAEKWGADVGPSDAHNEGLCVVSVDEGLVLAPWATLGGPTSVASPTRVIDLPAFEFPEIDVDPDSIDEDSWLHTSIQFAGATRTLSFRPTYYQGSRDTDPRSAQACLLGWAGIDGGAIRPACVLVNVHLSTLTRENVSGMQGRVPCPEATFQRDLQLKVVARFVRGVQRSHGLPVIIAGDFNAEPESPELLAFARESNSAPLLRSDSCWRCGARQDTRVEMPFYRIGESGLALTTAQQPSKPVFGPVCGNDSCREPRFTHKQNLQLIDNVFVTRAAAGASWAIGPGAPRVDLGWAYSDHAAIVVPLHLLHRDRGPAGIENENAYSLRN